MTSDMITRFFILLLYWSTSVKNIAALRCFNCGTYNTDTCDNFDPNNSSFIVDCPKKFSCGLEIHVDKKIRSCEEVFIDDCQKANSIEYCYCTGNLCNGNTIQLTPLDDEDYIEGSGTTVTTTLNPTTTFKTQVIVPKSSNGQDRVTIASFLIFILYTISSVM